MHILIENTGIAHRQLVLIMHGFIPFSGAQKKFRFLFLKIGNSFLSQIPQIHMKLMIHRTSFYTPSYARHAWIHKSFPGIILFAWLGVQDLFPVTLLYLILNN